MKTLVAIWGFGLAGVTLRYLIDSWLKPASPVDFPLSTFAINLGGSFLIGCVYVLTLERNVISPDLRLPLTTGFLGALTTFSAFSMQTLQLLLAGQFPRAALYFVASPVLGLALAAAGVWVTRGISS
jgi:CrcB protein